ncbi:hypothetical protein M513_09927 [Trichuris suis]|uniref:Uncharacterized protein n=1 Tax=Trichuris suis TaxID=68888 RepID=A0A085LW59_9BILA|nr:hypothetical protein M513_09927 [Trichuris suis]
MTDNNPMITYRTPKEFQWIPLLSRDVFSPTGSPSSTQCSSWEVIQRPQTSSQEIWFTSCHYPVAVSYLEM